MSSNRSDKSISLDEEVARFQQVVAEALSTWSWIEYRVCWIFGLATISQNAYATNAAFYSVTNFRTKLDMTIEAVNHCDGLDPVRPEWERLVVKLGKANQQRVPLAHHSIAQWPQARPGDRVFLARPMLDQRTKSNALTYGNVKDRLSSFHKLMLEAEDVAQKIQDSPRRPKEPPQGLEHVDMPGSLRRQVAQALRNNDQDSPE